VTTVSEPSIPPASAEDLGAGDEADLAPLLAGRTVDLGRAVLATLALVFLTGAAVFAWQQEAAQPDPSAVDIGFADDMRTHHLQGVTLALTYLEDGEDPVLRSMAEEIVIVQAGEARLMSQWLIDWGNPEVDLDTAMGWMGMAPTPQTEQPGMAGEEEVAELEAAEGEELDDLFSALMIRHHRGGQHMAHYVAERGDEADVRALAEAIDTTQGSEVIELTLRRRDLGLEPG
jgi:uncharacterized protein (DUF305 family)